MLAVMSLSTESDLATSIPSTVPPTLTIPSEQPMGLTHPIVRPMDLLVAEPIQPLSDQSRKRCASELEGHRTVKAMKREPQDDIPLSLAINEGNHLPAAATAFAVPPIAPPVVFPVMQPLISPMSQSRPPSRPPTPPSAFATHNSFSSIKQQTPLTVTFPPFVAGSTSGPLTPLPLPTNIIPPIFPTLHSSWSDPVVPATRHQHSLSAGSITGSLVNLTSLPTTLLNTVSPSIAPPQPITAPLKPTTSVIGPPIGRMSRSGSINGTTSKSPYAPFTYQDGYPDSSAWHPKISNSSGRAGQSSWYMGSEPLHTFRKASSDFAGSMPGTSHNSPPTDDDDDDDDSDSDDSNGGKTIIHRVRVSSSE